MKKSIYLIVLALILGLVLTGCSLLSNISQVPTTGQSGIAYLTKGTLAPNNLVGLWHFDGDADDSSDYGNDGTVNGAGWVGGKFGEALSFGGNDSVVIPDSASLSITGELTIEVWANETSRGTYSKIVSRRSGTYFYFLGVANGKPYGGIGDGSTSTVTTQTVEMPLNEWHHLAFVYNEADDKMYLYYDGELTETVTVIQSLPAQIGVDLSIGADREGTANFFTGLIDEVRIWNVALTAPQILQSYEALHVDDDWVQWPGAYRTINEALAVADDGDTIIVHEGTYINDIWVSSLGTPAGYRITKSVTLLGAHEGNDPAGSTNRGGETILVRTNGVPYSLYAPNITIDGFMFGSSDPNTGGRLIISDVADNAIIRNCIIQNTPSASSGHGVYIYPGADNALIEYNTFSNTAWEAIASWQVSNAVITHNHISASGQHAIQMMGHAGSNNEISYNHISGILGKNAIQYWGGPEATISHNIIEGGNTMFDGIWLDNAADDSTVSYNQIFDTIYAGINIRETCTGVTVTYNDISGCGTGVEKHAGDVTGVLVNYNNIEGNSWGVSNYDTGNLNATCNWWGDSSGPYHSTNLLGTGNAVSDNVEFQPCLLSLAPGGLCGGPYNWTGFFRPVDNPGVLNVAKAGSAIPVKFSLNGDKGLEIFEADYPKSKEILCDSTTFADDAIDETVTAGGSSLNYDATADQYIYVWKTDKAWAGSCRQLVVKLIDGKSYYANFKFK